MCEYSYVVFTSFRYVLIFYGIEIIKELIYNTLPVRVFSIYCNTAPQLLYNGQKNLTIVRGKKKF